jgi:hypothetical protein
MSLFSLHLGSYRLFNSLYEKNSSYSDVKFFEYVPVEESHISYILIWSSLNAGKQISESHLACFVASATEQLDVCFSSLEGVMLQSLAISFHPRFLLKVKESQSIILLSSIQDAHHYKAVAGILTSPEVTHLIRWWCWDLIRWWCWDWMNITPLTLIIRTDWPCPINFRLQEEHFHCFHTLSYSER